MTNSINHDSSLDADIPDHLKMERKSLIAAYRPDLGTAAALATSAADVQKRVEHACRTVNQSPKACDRAIAGVSQACQDCVMRYLADRSLAS